VLSDHEVRVVRELRIGFREKVDRLVEAGASQFPDRAMNGRDGAGRRKHGDGDRRRGWRNDYRFGLRGAVQIDEGATKPAVLSADASGGRHDMRRPAFELSVLDRFSAVAAARGNDGGHYVGSRMHPGRIEARSDGEAG